MTASRALLTGSMVLLLPCLLGLPGCEPDVTLKRELGDEQKQLQRTLADRGVDAEVDVHATLDGRQVEVTVPGAPDSLANMNVFSPPDTARTLARNVARDVKATYEDFEEVQEVKVGFTNESATWTSSVTLEGKELRALDP